MVMHRDGLQGRLLDELESGETGVSTAIRKNDNLDVAKLALKEAVADFRGHIVGQFGDLVTVNPNISVYLATAEPGRTYDINEVVLDRILSNEDLEPDTNFTPYREDDLGKVCYTGKTLGQHIWETSLLREDTAQAIKMAKLMAEPPYNIDLIPADKRAIYDRLCSAWQNMGGGKDFIGNDGFIRPDVVKQMLRASAGVGGKELLPVEANLEDPDFLQSIRDTDLLLFDQSENAHFFTKSIIHFPYDKKIKKLGVEYKGSSNFRIRTTISRSRGDLFVRLEHHLRNDKGWFKKVTDPPVLRLEIDFLDSNDRYQDLPVTGPFEIYKLVNKPGHVEDTTEEKPTPEVRHDISSGYVSRPNGPARH